MPTRKIRPLPPELTKLLFTLGPRKLILLEGPTDVEIFREWYRHLLSQLEFYPSIGHDNVQDYLSQLLAQSTTKRVYGIIDRDFRDDLTVEKTYQNPTSHLFILRYYTIENYLLEPAVLLEELRQYHGDKLAISTEPELIQILLDLCRELKPIVTANSLFWEEYLASGTATIDYFGPSFPADNRSLLIQQTARRLTCSLEQAEKHLNQKERTIQKALTTLETAYTCINGKYLLQHLHQKFNLSTTKDHFRRLLTRTCRHRGLHADIRFIVENRVLGWSDTDEGLPDHQ